MIGVLSGLTRRVDEDANRIGKVRGTNQLILAPELHEFED